MALGVRIGLRPTVLPRRDFSFTYSIQCERLRGSRQASRRCLSSRALQPAIRATKTLHNPLLASSRLQQSNTPPTTPSSFFTPSLCRHASTTASPTAGEATPSTSAAASSPTSTSQLDWNNFFRLRTSRRRFSLVSSILTAFGSTTTTAYFISSSPEVSDFIAKTIPTDPFISMGLATFAAVLVGWLIGPFFGNAVWRVVKGKSAGVEFTAKEKAFFERIKRHRVNPQGASTNNPVPDYYGEKVGSVAGYRRWLKDQRAFNRKREGSFVS